MKTGKGQDRAVVEGQFSSQIDIYASDRACARQFPGLDLLERLVRANGEAPRVLELGGAAGILFDELARRGAGDAFLCNIELTHAYGTRQEHDRTRFVQGSALTVPAGDGVFDAVILRHVLHHLVGASFHETRRNQERALGEAWRVLRPGGLLLVEEQTVEGPWSCRMLFTLSRWSSRIGLRIEALQVRPSVVVGFLPKRRLADMMRALAGDLVREGHRRRPPLLRWRLTFLLRNTGDCHFALRKPVL